MTRPRALLATLGVALTVSAAAAQPVPAPAGAPMQTDEKALTRLERDASTGDAVSPADEREAHARFLRGNDDLNNGLFLQAVDEYTAALVRWDHPAIHYNLALALINLDRPLEIYDHLRKAIAYGAEALDLDKTKYDHAQEYLRLVQGQLAAIEVSCEEPGARITVDGKEVFIAPGTYAAKVRVGKHTIVADKQGYNARVVAPFLGPGELVRIELKLYTTEDLTRYRRRWDKAWLPYGVIGAGALIGIIGGGFELAARGSFHDYDTQVTRCAGAGDTSNSGCPSTPALQHTRDRGTLERTTGMVMYGVAGGAIAVGATLAWINRRQAYQVHAEDLAGPQVSVTPVIAPGMAGALVQGHF